MAVTGHSEQRLVRVIKSAPVTMTWHDRLLGLRDVILSNPSFQRFAGTFPLTRPIARQRAGALFDLCAGFVYSQILLACVRLKLFDVLASPKTADEVASRLDLPRDRVVTLLDAAAALKLVQKRSQDRYGLGPLGASLCGNPGVVAMIEHHAILYGDLADPVALLRGDSKTQSLSSYWPYAASDAPANLTRDAISPYTALMSASQPMIAQEVLAAFSFKPYRCLLDVGGGDGAFLSAVAQRYPQLQLKLFDLPAVAEKASERFQSEGLASRATATGGSFLTDPLPQGADIVSLVRILHDHNDDHVLTLLRSVRAALKDGDTLLVAEPMAGLRGTETISDAYFGFYLMAMGSGRPRDFSRFEHLFEKSGFGVVKFVPTSIPLLCSIVTAQAVSKR